MIKTLSAYTLEIDDCEKAVSEILSQLDLGKNLLKNSVGIVSCYSEFIESGVVKALREKLPFDIIGTTTISGGIAGVNGQLMLSIAVITGDDVSFSTALSQPLMPDNFKKHTASAYEDALSRLGQKPAMIFICSPLFFDIAGDEVIRAIDEVSGGVPLFGTLAVDHTKDYHTAHTLFNESASLNRLSMLLIAGNINPSFSVASVPEHKIVKQKAIITKSHNNLLIEVNDMPVVDYMTSIGLAANGKIEGLNTLSFTIDFNDGTKPLVRGIFGQTPEGYAICGGSMPVNATLGIGSVDHDDVIAMTAEAMKKLPLDKLSSGLFVFSCISRNMALGFDITAEIDAIENIVGGKVPYLMAYSGGEICPVYDKDGKPVNRFHNETLITCLF
ncbi:MAG: FIST C-terminal domain-containing protein [Elusimicrobiota bacterium]|jgi:hypothetical protein|nr:FIST C-terminal domain-containing protein [Elusimicrobiota bacterium]